MNVLLLVLGIILFFGLVVVHEWGHFIAAKRNGVTVEEFGIGFPPRLFRHKTRGGWVFSINLLPLGGFVKLKGEHDTDTEPGSMGAASVWGKTQIMTAGVLMNLITAYVLLVVLAVVGMPQLLPNQFTVKSDTTYLSRAQTYVAAGEVEKNSPAAKAGLKSGDLILAFGPVGHMVALKSGDQLPRLTKQYAGQTVTLKYRVDTSPRLNLEEVTATVKLRSASEVAAAKAAGKQIGYLGASVYEGQNGITTTRSTWSAPVVAAGIIKQTTVLTFEGLGAALKGLGSIIVGAITQNTAQRIAGQDQASSQVAGPIGVFFIFEYGSALGLTFIIFIVAILSLTLAIMNILPIPALDGGRLWLMLITRAIKRPLKASHEEAINAAGFALMMGLIILISIVDVRRFF